jgi:hypothetical protein
MLGKKILGREKIKLNRCKDHLIGKLNPIHAHDGKVTKGYAVCSNRKMKGAKREKSVNCDMCPRKPGLHHNKCFAMCHTVKSTVWNVANRNILHPIELQKKNITSFQ